MSSIIPPSDAAGTRQTESSSETSKTEPPPPVPGDNRFQKMIKKGPLPSTSKEDLEQLTNEVMQEETSPPSLFELSKKSPKAKSPFFQSPTESSRSGQPLTSKPSLDKSPEEAEATPGKGLPVDEQAGSEEVIQQAVQEQSTRSTVKKSLLNDQAVLQQSVRQETGSSSVKGQDSSKESGKKEKTKGAQESSDDSGIDKTGAGIEGVHNPVQGVNLGSEKAGGTERPAGSVAATLKELADKLVDTVQVLQKSDRTETTVTLRSPPMLANVTVTLTAFEHAKGEFNIAFAGLSPEAKLLMDQKLAENSLNRHLSEKGIVVHIVTTSTDPHPSFSQERENPSNKDREPQDRRERRDRQREEEET